MEFLRRSWTQVRAYLAGLSYSEKAVAVMAAVVLLVVFIWLVQYWAKPELAPITQFAGERQAQAVAKLQSAGIKVTQSAGQVLVPTDKLNDALVVLAQADLMSPDTTAAFDEYIKHQSPLLTNSQSAREFLLAKQKVLGTLVARMAGVRSADVMVSIPEDQGFGHTAPKPSASVTVIMQGKNAVDRPLVEAIAGLIAGANSPMQPQDVVVLDANHGRSMTVASADSAMPSTTFELLKSLEEYFRCKVDNTLSYIDGRIVNVTVQIDPMRSRTRDTSTYEKTEPLLKTSERNTSRTDNSGGGGEPGARSNTGTDIAGGGGSGSSETTSDSETTYGPKPLIEHAISTDVGHLPKQVSVTVNIPRGFFVNIFKHGKPAGTPDPDDAALKPVVAEQINAVESQVQNLINTESKTGTVKAYMIPDPGTMLAVGSGGSAHATGVGAALDSGLAKPIGLGLLGVVSLAMMFGMVRKATRQPKMPTVEELAGLPPALPAEEDLVGEADETDPSMAGVELNEDEIRTRKIAEQIGELVKGNPAEAASLIRRWVRTDE